MSTLEEPPTTAATDEVGYCRPPKSSQWKPGQSGNPTGKKKGVNNFGTQLQKVLSKVVKVKIGGKAKKLTYIELMVNALFQHGMEGDTKNAAFALKLVEEFGIESPKPYPPKPGKIWKSDEGKYCITESTKKLSPEELRKLERRLADIVKTANEYLQVKSKS
ncbi:MAG TPA: DUF5681 domain-containing protein [Rhizomicrobium sp.]